VSGMLARSSLSQKPHRDPFDLKVSLPTLSGPVFLRLIVGTERRNFPRLVKERQTSKRTIAFTYAVIGWLAASSSGFGFFCVAYLVKSALGINLWSGPSPFHPLYTLFLEH
jgi:hypothetical protein